MAGLFKRPSSVTGSEDHILSTHGTRQLTSHSQRAGDFDVTVTSQSQQAGDVDVTVTSQSNGSLHAITNCTHPSVSLDMLADGDRDILLTFSAVGDCNEWHSFHARVGRFSPFLYLRSVAIAVILFWLQLVVLVSPCFLGSRISRDYRFPPAPLFLCSERKPSSLTTGSSKL